jgi:hypothetical protein
MLIGRMPGEAQKGKVTTRANLIGAGQPCTPRDKEMSRFRYVLPRIHP